MTTLKEPSIDAFWHEGVEIMSGGLTAREVADAERALDQMAPRLPGAAVYLQDVWHGAFEAVFQNTNVIARLEKLLGGKTRIYFTDLVVVPPDTTAMGSVWHHDREPRGGRLGVKVSFCFSDVLRPGDGEVRYYPWIEHVMKPGPNATGRPVFAARGDVVLSRPDLWHRSTKNTSLRTQKRLYAGYTKDI